MNPILSLLAEGDLRSDGNSNEVAGLVLQNPELVDELIADLDEPDDVVRGHTADALEKIARSRPDLVVGHLPRLLEVADADRLPVVKMHLAMILGHLVVYDEHIQAITPALLDLLDDESVFVRSWAIASLCIVARKCPAEQSQIMHRVGRLEGDGSPAIRARVRKAMVVLSDPEAEFPKGWIKSELLFEK